MIMIESGWERKGFIVVLNLKESKVCFKCEKFGIQIQENLLNFQYLIMIIGIIQEIYKTP